MLSEDVEVKGFSGENVDGEDAEGDVKLLGVSGGDIGRAGRGNGEGAAVRVIVGA